MKNSKLKICWRAVLLALFFILHSSFCLAAVPRIINNFATTNTPTQLSNIVAAVVGNAVAAGTNAFNGNGGNLTNINKAKSLVGWFNVEDYGAAAGAESTLAISNAIRAAEALPGGVVYFPGGPYHVSSTLWLSNRVTLRGNTYMSEAEDAPGSVVTITNTGSEDTFSSASGTLVNGLTIERMFIRSASGSGAGLRLVGPTDHVVLDQVQIGGHEKGLAFTDVGNVTATRMTIRESSVGYEILGSVANSIKFSGCGIAPTVDIGYVLGGGHVTIENADINAGTIGVDITAGTHALLGLNFELQPTATAAIRAYGVGSSSFLVRGGRVIGGGASTYSISVSNYPVAVDDFNMTVGVGGYPIEEWGDGFNNVRLPFAVANGGMVVTNRTRQFAYFPRPVPVEITSTGTDTSFASADRLGSTWYQTRTNATGYDDKFWMHAKFANGQIAGVNLFDTYTQTKVYNRFFVGTNAGTGYSGAGFTDGGGGLDIAANRLVLGSDALGTTRGNNTLKVANFGMVPYANASPTVNLLLGVSQSGANTVYIGGGTSDRQSATEGQLRASASVSTGSGNVVARWTTGGWFVGPTQHNTNGIASYLTTTGTIAASGWTNTMGVNAVVMGLTGTSVVQTNGAWGSGALGFSRGTITVPTDVVLKPNAFINGSSIAAEGIQAW